MENSFVTLEWRRKQANIMQQVCTIPNSQLLLERTNLNNENDKSTNNVKYN